MAYEQGDVVLLPFPFRDRLAESPRPTVVVSVDGYNNQGDIVIAAITSHPPRGPFDYSLADWAAAGLKKPSTVRMLLATAAHARVVHFIGHLSDRDWAEVHARVLQVIT